jgi:hypothetical protein
MRFYLISNGTHFETLDEARAEVRDEVKRRDWRDVYVDEVEIPLDKANVRRLLNNEGGTHQYLRQWGATARGGIKLQEREEEESCTEATSAT